MATTPIYGFVTPDLGSTADGPAALAALASRVERQMTTLRAMNEYAFEPNSSWNTGTVDDVIAQQTVPTSVIGWMTIHVGINISSNSSSISGLSPDNVTAAGQFEVVLDDVLIKQYRWHMLWGTKALALSTAVSAARTAAQTSANIKVRLDIEGQPVFVNHINLRVEQFGAPASG